MDASGSQDRDRGWAGTLTLDDMDALARLLDAPRGRDAYLVRTTLAAPWSIRLADGAPLGLVAVLHGSAWISGDDGLGVELRAGDVAVAKGPADATLADPADAPPDVVLMPGPRLVDRDGTDVHEAWTLGHRHVGNDPAGSTVLMLGCYQLQGEVTQRLLKALPQVIHLSAVDLDTPLLSLLADEIVKDAPGQAAVLDRLFDLLLVAVLRAWVTSQQPEGPYAAQTDSVVGPALRLLHTDPARNWTIADLARAVGVSRASLAQRFTRLVGEPPMTYLTGWRVALAADLLLEPSSTIERVAREVGYGSPFALSVAFKRERGISPREHRARTIPS